MLMLIREHPAIAMADGAFRGNLAEHHEHLRTLCHCNSSKGGPIQGRVIAAGVLFKSLSLLHHCYPCLCFVVTTRKINSETNIKVSFYVSNTGQEQLSVFIDPDCTAKKYESHRANTDFASSHSHIPPSLSCFFLLSLRQSGHTGRLASSRARELLSNTFSFIPYCIVEVPQLGTDLMYTSLRGRGGPVGKISQRTAQIAGQASVDGHQDYLESTLQSYVHGGSHCFCEDFHRTLLCFLLFCLLVACCLFFLLCFCFLAGEKTPASNSSFTLFAFVHFES